MAIPNQPVTPSQTGIVGRIKNNPIITILALAAGILYAVFPPAFLMSVASLPVAAAISGVASALIAFTGLSLFHSLVEWLSPIMFPGSVVKHANNNDQDVSSDSGSASAMAALGGPTTGSTDKLEPAPSTTTAGDNQELKKEEQEQEQDTNRVRLTLV